MKPDIKKYLNVFQFLQDHYKFRKVLVPHFSYEIWAQELGASDKSYVRLMVLGKRSLNEKMIESFRQNLSLSKVEQIYFLNLVEYSQSKTREQREVFGRKLIDLLKNDLDQIEIKSHFDFLSNPLLPRLQVFLSFEDLEQTPSKLAWLMGEQAEEVEKGIAQLISMGLIEMKNGRYQPLKKSYKVPDHFGDLALESFYGLNLQASQSAIHLPKDERRFKSLFLPLNAQEFSEFIENMQKFVSEQLRKFNPDRYDDRRLYQVHLNIIPSSAKNEIVESPSINT